jgi:prophage regulatory protein
LLGYRDLERLKNIPYTRSHIDRLEGSGRFPKRVKIGGYGIAWWEDEIDQWKAEREAAAAIAAKAKVKRSDSLIEKKKAAPPSQKASSFHHRNPERKRASAG